MNNRIVLCTFDSHAASILNILNEAIVNSTALYDYKQRKLESMLGWFEAKQAYGFPVIGIENQEGILLGFGSYGAFRAWPAYKYTVEHSVYVHKDFRGKGLGQIIMRELVTKAQENELHAMVGGIDANKRCKYCPS